MSARVGRLTVKGLELVKTVLLVGALTGAFALGQYQTARTYKIEDLLEQSRQAAATQVQLQQAVKVQAELQEQLKQMSGRTSVIREQVKVYVEPDKDEYCGPSVGVISMFNAARTDMPAHPAGNVEEGRAPSGYSATDFNDHNLDVIERYNALAIEHNKLIELLANEPN